MKIKTGEKVSLLTDSLEDCITTGKPGKTVLPGKGNYRETMISYIIFY